MTPRSASASRPSSSAARATVEALRARPECDVLIIGAGINGIATFRDLALNGVDVVLVDRDDYVAGASSGSSHMIHGGIRYLENGEFRLVQESVHERNALLRLAPHYVRPLPTTIPIFSTFSSLLSAPLKFIGVKTRGKKERGALIIKVGLTIYDIFSRDGGRVPRHQFRGATASRALLPALRGDVKWTATYYDASMHDPERLALDVLMDGVAVGDRARASNYVEAAGMDAEGAVLLRDAITREEFSMRPRVVVNASGPWTDLTNDALGAPSQFMGGTKGSHIVVDHPELLAACNGREIFFEFTDGRIVLIYPLKGRVLIGTTDIAHDMAEPIRCTEEEVDYFFDVVKYVFPSIPVDRSHIVFRFSGVRPLPRQDAASNAQISRDYRVEEGAVAGTPVLSLVGGKWTTFRALGEQLGGRVLALLGRSRSVSTDGRLIGGAVGYPTTPEARAEWLSQHGATVGAERAAELLERYGTSAEAIIRRIESVPDAPLAAAPDYSRAEIAHLAETEQVVRLVDVLLRRTSLAFRGLVTEALLAELAELLGDSLGWDSGRRAQERDDARLYLADRHGIDLTPADTTGAASRRGKGGA
ncbi:glycerol-3-phosphate dehydrogenase/oxidase [Microcella humidisoli]|uniref:Glycerol-3-phosphate dehydrogenase/oxidase n=1 Tax=Microcella humidisoli TaxID=2963406 RepID=A0ABY5FYT3_9MICO|nr:glycerol-3-phosphate dehydrogenase/oxidase [Microcella humidisoli]UTT63077.1 glycerol-3-phosphate dehydrogenase/oxidase [Microcella humidisoli]